ncbi:MAG: TonB-dependent receptor [Woeseiaceae bacterium]|nr:TonB-dependent receptor [Woeseiaceae bacterium]
MKQISAACALAFAFSAATALAQDEEIEEITVTGSHIEGLELDGALPAVEISREDIDESGADTLVNLLDQLTQTGGGNGTFTTEGSGPGSQQNPVGSSAVSLRGLGTSSTLTLVNGRRVSVASFAKGGTESFVDINSIPLAAIERVEVLTSGASATYGADAVAGVVNVILRDDYEGFEVSVSGGNSTASSDDGKYNVNMIWGAATDRTRTMIVADYFKRGALFERDRSITAISADPSADSAYLAFNSSAVSLSDVIDEDNCAAVAGDRFTPGDSSFGRACLYNVNDVVAAIGEFESVGVTASFNVDFDRVTWFNELMYQTTESFGNRSGASFGGSGLALSPFHPGWANEQELIDALEVSYSNATSDDYTPVGGLSAVDVLNLIENDSSTFGRDADDYFYTVFGRFDDPRETEVETDSFRFVTGLSGEAGDWSWEAAASIGRSESVQRGTQGLINRERLQAGLLGNLCSDGSTVTADYEYFPSGNDIANKRNVSYFPGGATCEDNGLTTLWVDPFNNVSDQSADILELLRVEGARKGESDLLAFDFKASTLELFDVPAGPVAAAFGLDWRREEISDVPDRSLLATPENSDPVLAFSSTGALYERDQFSVFGEMYVPIFDGFEAQLALRYDDYEDFGGDTNGKIGLRYEVTEKAILRANWSQSYRAPSLAQAGLTTKLNSYRAFCDSSDQFSQFFLDQGICGGFDSTLGLNTELVGNPDLEPETADTYGFGVLFRPTDDIDVNIDWWRIEYRNIIVDEQDAYVFNTLQGNTAGGIFTDPNDLVTGQPGLYLDNGELLDVHFQQFNAGRQDVEGIDVAYTQYFETDAYGTFTLLLDLSYLVEFEEQLLETSAVENFAGKFTYPELFARAKLRWRTGDWRTSLSLNYTGSYEDDLFTDAAENAGLDPLVDSVDVSSWTTVDLSASYDFTDTSYLQLNVLNALDEEPNRVFGSGANVDYTNTNIMGRFVTLRYTHGF